MRSLGKSSIVAACLVLVPATAFATVTPGSAGSSQVYLTSDDAGDDMALSCVANQVRYLAIDLLACDATQDVFIDGNGGNDNIDLSAIGPESFPVLSRVDIDAGFGADNVTGSQLGDTITGDTSDTVNAQGGNDVVTEAKTAFGGPGDDVLSTVIDDVDGGSGDDRIERPANGPISGGLGYDTVALLYGGASAQGLDLGFTFTDTDIHVFSTGAAFDGHVELTGVEHLEMTLYDNAVQTIDASAFTGDATITGGTSPDVMKGGSGENFLTGGAGGDTITGGPGFDYVRGGPDDDVVDVRDGQVDRVLCGAGDDTVRADRTDLLVDCEHVSLAPPQTSKITGPKTVKKGAKATFTFTSSAAGSTYQCQVDAAAFKACKSPLKLATAQLAKGKHTLKVRAVQPVGNPDPTPSVASFKVT